MGVPVYHGDFYSDDFILNPTQGYADLRALGPVIWMEQQNAYAVTCYNEVVHVLRNPATFISGNGISMNDDVNALLKGSTVNSDGDEHDSRRRVTARPLMPKGSEYLEQYIHETAQALGDRLVDQQAFDAISEFAQILPLSIVIDLVGLDESGRQNMLAWGSAVFDVMDGHNERSQVAFETLVGLRKYLDKYGRAEYLKEGGLARRIFELAPEHGFSEADAAQMMRDYISPSLDTTISASGYMAYFFATHPDQWDLLLSNPDLVPNAIEEVVRLTTPIRSFSRYVAEDTEISGTKIEKGSRVMVIYGSANRDETYWVEPDRFDITRNVRKHVGFGHGVHLCMGMHLARREMINLLEAMRTRVARWELNGTPEIQMNNSIRAFSKLPIKITPQ